MLPLQSPPLWFITTASPVFIDQHTPEFKKFHFQAVSKGEIQRIVMSFQSNKAPRYDKAPMSVIRLYDPFFVISGISRILENIRGCSTPKGWRPQFSKYQSPGTRLCKFDHITSVLRGIKWRPVTSMLVYRDGILAFRCSRGLAPDYLAKKFKTRCEIHNRDKRNKNKIDIPGYRTEAGQKYLHEVSLKISEERCNSSPTAENREESELFKMQYDSIYEQIAKGAII